MNYEALAFFTGLFGSIHCVGMCGPLAFAVPSFHQNRWLVAFDKLIYQFGRIITYSLLGLMIGFIGKQLWLSGLQQGVSIITGILILTAALSRLFKLPVNIKLPLLNPVNKLINYALKHRANHLICGILNGFLPCGFVYLALAGAVNMTGLFESTAYMFWFGMGTLPIMLISAISLGLLSPLFRKRANKVVPYFMLLLGFWFVLRGLTLDIPYLSPAKADETIECK